MKSAQQTLSILAFALLGSIVAQTDATFAQTATAEAETAADQMDASQLGSLMRVPESTGLYFSTMNHKAIVDSIFESNAYKSMKSSDVARGMKKAYRRGRTRGYDDYNRRNPFAEYLQGYGESIDNVVFQSVWQIAKQVIDNELFLYVDNDALPLIATMQQAQADMMNQFGLDNNFDFDEMTKEQAEELVEKLSDAIESLECPTMIMGSRLDNPQGFRGMLELARSFAEQGMRNLPPELEIVREFWKVVEEEDNFLLMGDIDLSKLPWDEFLKEAKPDQSEILLQFRDAMSEKEAVIAMGIVDNLLIVGIAKDRDRLTGFGDGAKLIDMESLKPLRKSIDQNEKVVSVFYMSQQYAEASYSMENFYQQIKPMIRPIIDQIDEIPDDQKEQLVTRIEAEANEFIADFKDMIPPRAMTFGFATLHDDGLHGYSRSNTTHPMLDGSKPLNLAKHASPDTIAFFNQRLYRLTEQYNLLSKWTSKLYGYGRNFGLEAIQKEMAESNRRPVAADNVEAVVDAVADREKAAVDQSLEEFNRELSADGSKTMSEDVPADEAETADPQDSDLAQDNVTDDDDMSENEPDFETIKSFLTDFEAIAQRFDTVTKQKLLPAIDGQEAGLFVDAVSGPNPWHPDMPVSKNPLPLPFPAFVIGTDDAKAVIETGEAYWELADELLTSAKKHFPNDEVEEAFLLPPNRIEKNGDVSFRWSFLHDFGQVDASVQPGTLINDNWLVMNMHPEQAKRLTKPQTDRGVFGPADTDEPSIGLAFYDNRVATDALRKWIDFAETQIPPDESPFNLAERYPAERDTLQFTEPQLRDAFERVWAFGECFKGLSARTYEDGNATISESLMKFEDIAAE